MRTAFKDIDLSVYGMRVVEPHHDGTPHWHMMLFCQRKQRQDVIDIMRRYALKEDGDERGAAKNRFEAMAHEQGRRGGVYRKIHRQEYRRLCASMARLTTTQASRCADMAAAVTSWASTTWRIPQFKPIGIPTMGAYRECRGRMPSSSISLADSFDERVVRLCVKPPAPETLPPTWPWQGAQTSRVMCRPFAAARKAADAPNAYDEEVQKVVGIFAPHLGAGHIHETRSTEWRIVRKAVDVNPLTLKAPPARLGVLSITVGRLSENLIQICR